MYLYNISTYIKIDDVTHTLHQIYIYMHKVSIIIITYIYLFVFFFLGFELFFNFSCCQMNLLHHKFFESICVLYFFPKHFTSFFLSLVWRV